MILNDLHVLTAGERHAFGRPPQEQVFQPGTVLHRFVTRGENASQGDWWVTSATLELLRTHATRSKVPLANVVRARLAIARHWSPRLDFLVSARLSIAARGWVGAARHQRVDATRANANVVFLGGTEQVLLPNLLGDTHRTQPKVRKAHGSLPSPRAVVIAHQRL
ncbi:MAG: hypothetical protein JNL12_10045 [Planctomycetes bacterium]|nr:hypothetical protein [Planctomycetota bacterium]